MATRVLLTGGSGFIGRNLGPALAERGYEVLAPPHAELELADAGSVRAWLERERPDVVVHSATKPAHRNASDLTRIVETNERMFFNLVRSRELCPRMIFLGSGAVYDEEHYVPRMPETYFDAHVPADDHGFSKYVIAKYVEAVDHITELRVFGIFGPHEDYAIRFISNAICKTLIDLPVTLKRNRRFDYIDVADLAPVVAHFLEQSGAHRAYNVTPDATVELLDLAHLVVRISGKDLPVVVAEDGYGREYSGDNARLHAEMPGLAFTPLEVSVQRLYDWYAENIDRIDRSKLLVDR